MFFYKRFFSALSYTSRPYLEAMAMRPEVTYTPYVTSSKEQTGDVITFTKFDEEIILTETRNDAESGDKFDKELIMMSEQDKENFHDKEIFDDDHISRKTLHEICERNDTNLNIDKREARLKIRDHNKQNKS